MGNSSSKTLSTHNNLIEQYNKLIKNGEQPNEFIKHLVICYCNDKELQHENICLPISIIAIIVSYCDIDMFKFKNYDKSMFQINRLGTTNHVIKKIQDYEHATIIFGDYEHDILKNKGFAFENFNFVFRFKLVNGISYLLFVPSSFGPYFTGYMNEEIALKQNLQLEKLRGHFCQYDDIVRVEIDMISLSVVMINETNNKIPAKQIKIKNNTRIAFSLMNPYSELHIIDQCWLRKKQFTHVNKCIEGNIGNNNDYDPADNDVEMIDHNSNSVTNNQNNQQNYELPIHIVQTLKPGLNYIGKCDPTHIYAICNRGFSYDNDIRPREDYLSGNILCNHCNNRFKYDLLILYDCSYVLNYAVNHQGIQTTKGVAYPNYVDIKKDVLKNQSYNYLTINTKPLSGF